jgi:hypothetical protein
MLPPAAGEYGYACEPCAAAAAEPARYTMGEAEADDAGGIAGEPMPPTLALDGAGESTSDEDEAAADDAADAADDDCDDAACPAADPAEDPAGDGADDDDADDDKCGADADNDAADAVAPDAPVAWPKTCKEGANVNE